MGKGRLPAQGNASAAGSLPAEVAARALSRFPGSLCRNQGQSDTSWPCCRGRKGLCRAAWLCGNGTPHTTESPERRAGQALSGKGLRLALFSRRREGKLPFQYQPSVLVSEPLPTPPPAGHSGNGPWRLRSESVLPEPRKVVPREGPSPSQQGWCSLPSPRSSVDASRPRNPVPVGAASWKLTTLPLLESLG